MSVLAHPLMFTDHHRKSWKKSSNRAMADRIWRSEDLTEELALYNHWLLLQSQEGEDEKSFIPRESDTSKSKYGFMEAHGFSAIIPFEGAGIFDISLRLSAGKFKINNCTTVRARKNSTGKLYTIIIVDGKDIISLRVYT